MGNFSAGISDWKSRTISQIDEGVNYAIETFCIQVIEDTPVDDTDNRDTIVAKNNWSLEKEGGDGTMVANDDMTGDDSRESVKSTLAAFRATKDPKLVFMNNAFGVSRYSKDAQYYANVLEFGLYPWPETERTTQGYSRQAVGGFVRKNLTQFHFALRSFFGKSITDFTRVL